jgi:putative sporulation protein YtaF
MWLQLIVLAFAVSIDGFGVGMTFGLKNMKIPFKSILVIACCSAVSLGLAMIIGGMIGQIVSEEAAVKTGGAILVLLGLWMVYQYVKPKRSVDVTELENKEKTIFKFEIKSLGVVINILHKPLTADFDKSGTINGVEAIILGFALSLDAFGAGIGAAMLGASPWVLALCVAFMSLLFIWAGLQSGRMLSSSKVFHHLSALPGILLIMIGLYKL